jgi:hypothetical protein
MPSGPDSSPAEATISTFLGPPTAMVIGGRVLRALR